MNYIEYLKFIALMILMALMNSLTVFAQSNNERLCVLFEKESQVIEINGGLDSTRYGFNIIKEGFETKEAREEAGKKALEAHEKNPFINFQYPEMYLVYTSSRKPTEYDSTEHFNFCKVTVSLDEFRKNDFVPPKQTGLSQIYLIQRSEEIILVWAASYFE